MNKPEYQLVSGDKGKEVITDFRQTSNCFDAYEINPAVGCDFGCTYCSMYGQEAELKHSPVKIFTDYPEDLENHIRENRDRQFTFNFTPKSDAFAPSLIDSGVSSEILSVLHKYDQDFYILTKSGIPNAEIMNKLEYSSDLGQIIISSGLPDESMRKQLEPNAATIEDRMEFAKACKDIGIPVTGIVAPYLPFDIPGYKEAIIERYKNAGVDHLSVQLLKVSADCLDRMMEQMPNFADRLQQVYSDACGSVNWRVPGGNEVERYYANTDVLIKDLNEFKNLASKQNVTVSTCKDVQKLIGNPKFNNEAAKKGITCVGWQKK